LAIILGNEHFLTRTSGLLMPSLSLTRNVEP
jgi:hypothetical protein